MPKFDRLNLLKFLSKPRFLHEVAEHYGIPKTLANFHLREAIKAGHVLVSEKPIIQTLKDPNGKQKRLGGFVYVFQKSPMLIDGWAQFAASEANNLVSKSESNVFNIRFLSKAHGALGKEALNDKPSCRVFKERPRSNNLRSLETKCLFMSEFDLSSPKVKSAKWKTGDRLLGRKTWSTQEEVRSLSHLERIRLFQALLKEPLPFLDLHGRFGVSKQTIRGFVKNGLLMEMWGPKAIGVRFKLTNKGKIYLKELEAASKMEPKMRETAFIRLKHITPL